MSEETVRLSFGFVGLQTNFNVVGFEDVADKDAMFWQAELSYAFAERSKIEPQANAAVFEMKEPEASVLPMKVPLRKMLESVCYSNFDIPQIFVVFFLVVGFDALFEVR